MKNFVQPVNVVALKTATEAVVGQEVTDTIVRVYKAIDQAMFDGYQLGREDAEAEVDDRLDRAFDTGFSEGQKVGAAEAKLESVVEDMNDAYDDGYNDAYDEGYVNGVSDARARPALADENVQDIINEQAGEYYDALEDQLDFFEAFEPSDEFVQDDA